MNEKEKNNSGLKKFIDWVNSDTDLPPHEELEDVSDGHDDHDDFDDHDEHDEHEPDEHHDAPKTEDVVIDALDEEFDYSDMFTSSKKSDDVPEQDRQLYPQSMMVTSVQSPPMQFAYRVLSVALTISIIAVLLVTLAYMPPFGHPGNPTNNEVYTRYIEKGVEDTGALNIIAAMILDYRAFDTLGEAFVLFTAVIAVILLIRNPDVKPIISWVDKAEQPFMLRYAVMLVAPFVMIFGIYILLNGHLTPGGGFSGGAILGAGMSLYAASYGIEKVRTIFNFKRMNICIGSALLFYALAKGYSFAMGAGGLSTGIPLGTPGNLLSGGLILPLNISVGFVVACTVYGLYALFSEGEV